MTTQTTVQSLLARFNNAEKKTLRNGSEYYPERNIMERELKSLLENEMRYDMRYSTQADIDALKEFKDCFDWDIKYGVRVDWEIECSTASQLIDCSSADDVAEYLSGAKVPEIPSFDDIRDDIDYGCDLTGDFSTYAYILVDNLRPKEMPNTAKYIVKMILECDVEVESLEQTLLEVLQQSSVIKHSQVCSITAEV